MRDNLFRAAAPGAAKAERLDGSQFLQLQYKQSVNLNFLDIDWPHVSVGTLVKT